MDHRLITADSLELLPTLQPNSLDACVTDTPYGLPFARTIQDRGVPDSPIWREVLRVLKPGAFLLAMGGSRTHHRLITGIEDAGFRIMDLLVWVYGSGFPKNKMVLKPALDPICIARKPFKGTLKANLKRWGTGMLNIDACRLEEDGSWPRNLIIDPVAAALMSKQARMFYCPKPTRQERDAGCEQLARRDPEAVAGKKLRKGKAFPGAGSSPSAPNHHPAVKPVGLMRWLVRLATPEGGTVLDPYGGTGTTAIGAVLERRGFVVCEIEKEYTRIAQARVRYWKRQI